ncbi:hypothetical protein HMPREF3220_02405 [Citrobacter koseri]|nr:hypothetical protein HMPREF3220_02405 [Citrobacter koseri]KWZ99585.1 hypothetical protein HMPREF3207_03922 [Citrobacter koseri]
MIMIKVFHEMIFTFCVIPCRTADRCRMATYRLIRPTDCVGRISEAPSGTRPDKAI